MIFFQEIIYPKKSKTDPDVDPVAVMAAMEQDLMLLRRIMGFKGRGAPVIPACKLWSVAYRGQNISLAGPVLGAPQAVMILEKLKVLGAEKIIFFGWCGSLQQGVEIGEVVIPDRGVIGEGTSAYYPISEEYPKPSQGVLTALEGSLEARSLPFHKGPVWSTDAPYRETRDRIISLQRAGVLAVDMELSALLTAGRFRHVEVGALLVVSDELGELRWRQGFSSRKFKQSRRIAAEVLAETCLKLASRNKKYEQG